MLSVEGKHLPGSVRYRQVADFAKHDLEGTVEVDGPTDALSQNGN
jgi:hypothetical protein